MAILQASALSLKLQNQSLQVEEMLSRREALWGFDFVSPDVVLVAQKNGTLFLFDVNTSKGRSTVTEVTPKVTTEVTPTVTEVTGLPASVDRGQGGLLDVAIHPRSRAVYITYTEQVDGAWTTALLRAKLTGSKLTDVKKIFSARPANKNTIHFGSRVAFDQKDKIWISIGDRNDRHQAQDVKNDLGKIIQMDEDGGNKKVFSWGHRNPQGLYYSKANGELWSAEFGPRGGDELNLIEAGKNYGWPIVTFGREYYGPKIGEGSQKPGMQSPVVQWTPSISPSALLLYESDRIPEWRGSFFLACLGTQQILRVVLNEKKAFVKEESLLRNQVGRVRSLRTDAGGAIWFTTDEGKLFRISPASSSMSSPKYTSVFN